MHDQTNQEKSGEFARLDGAILGLLVNPDEQRPWSEQEITREMRPLGDLPDGLDRLHQAGLIHRWDAMASATHAAIRYHNITQSEDPHSADDRRMEERMLELLLTPGSRGKAPLSEKEIRRAIGVKRKQNLAFVDALDRLNGAGLVDRTGELVFATQAAARFDQIMTL